MTTVLHAAAAAVLTAAAALVSGTSIPLAVLLAIASATAMTDAREHRIPNVLAAAATLTAGILWLDVGAPLIPLAITVLAAVGLYDTWKSDALGGGDVKYLPALILAVATLGDPMTAVLRVLTFGVILLGVAGIWPRASDLREGPLTVGAPLALVVAAGL